MPQIQRTEVNTNHVLVYFEKVRFTLSDSDSVSRTPKVLLQFYKQSRLQRIFSHIDKRVEKVATKN